MACAISELLGDLEGILLDMSDSDNSSVIQNYSFVSKYADHKILSYFIVDKIAFTYFCSYIYSL